MSRIFKFSGQFTIPKSVSMQLHHSLERSSYIFGPCGMNGSQVIRIVLDEFNINEFGICSTDAIFDKCENNLSTFILCHIVDIVIQCTDDNDKLRSVTVACILH